MRLMISSGCAVDDDFLVALKVLDDAARNLQAVARLPKEIGRQVKWPSGVVWTRIDANSWYPTTSDGIRWLGSPTASSPSNDWWPSDHVAANGNFEVLP